MTASKGDAGGRPPTPAPDPFAPESLRLPQDFGVGLGVKKIPNHIPVRKPDRQWFIRTHPERLLETAVIELKEDNETFLVVPDLYGELAGELVPKVLRLSITRQGLPFFWPIRLPDESGRLDDWNRSALEAARHAERDWLSVRANRHAGAYEMAIASGNFPEPEWPDRPMPDLLRIAFRDRLIDRPDHPVIARLRGTE